jgi:hypothetical protein
MEGKSVARLIEMGIFDLPKYFTLKNKYFLMGLQESHDGYSDQRETRLKEIAVTYGLKYTEQ